MRIQERQTNLLDRRYGAIGYRLERAESFPCYGVPLVEIDAVKLSEEEQQVFNEMTLAGWKLSPSDGTIPRYYWRMPDGQITFTRFGGNVTWMIYAPTIRQKYNES